MNTIEYATMAEREKTYWWHLGRLRIIERYIAFVHKTGGRYKILNIGCGTGGTIDMLEKYGTTDNVDVSDSAIAYMKQNGYGRIRKVKDIKLPYKDQTFDMVGAFDVLEHIKKEVPALKEWSRVLKNDGAIIITVPAYQWLWSEHDTSLHHQRRYTTKRLKEAARKAGLKPQKISYAIVFSLPLIAGFRFVHKILGKKADSATSYVDVPDWVNKFFTKLLYIESGLHTHISLPAGTSVVAVFRKAK